jgi:NAD kinase
VQKKVDGRGCAWVSLDGATRFKLGQGESVIVTGSDSNMKFVTQAQDDLTDLWIQRLKNMFNWNIRDSLKPITKKNLAYTSTN